MLCNAHCRRSAKMKKLLFLTYCFILLRQFYSWLVSFAHLTVTGTINDDSDIDIKSRTFQVLHCTLTLITIKSKLYKQHSLTRAARCFYLGSLRYLNGAPQQPNTIDFSFVCCQLVCDFITLRTLDLVSSIYTNDWGQHNVRVNTHKGESAGGPVIMLLKLGEEFNPSQTAQKYR